MKALMLIAATLLALPAAHAEIFRCAVPGGISYQQFPCATEASGGRTDLPTVFPEVDVAARDRLFAREAALDRRLEAERERLSRESMNRVSAQAQVAAAQAQAAQVQQPVYVLGWPMARPHHGARRAAPPRVLLR